MERNSRHASEVERAVRSKLHAMGFRFRVATRPIADLNCKADLIFRANRVAVFIDGCFWHGCPQHGVRPRTNSNYWHAKIEANMARDRRNDAALELAGWTVIRVWEHEPPKEAAERISRLVRERRAQLRGRPSTADLQD
jgi:DNA mismatch endonuclease (patch repair protein)